MDLDREAINYYDALYGPATVQVQLSGEGSQRALEVRRAGLGRHFYLRYLGERIGTAPLEERAGILQAWLEAAGVDPSPLALADLPAVVAAIKALNRPRGKLAWSGMSGEIEEKPTDYPGRDLARIADSLARHYGWSLADILDLPPEAALAHLQECVLSDRKQREWEHYLSEIGWQYDRITGMSRYRPLPPLPWESGLLARRQYTPVSDEIVERYYPKGVVIDLTKQRDLP